MATDTQQACPCGGGEFSECCGPIIEGSVKAETPERVMRARYTAYATGAIAFLEKSNHSKTRQQFDPVEAARWSHDSRWLGMDILSSDSGLPGRAHVNFEARYEDKDGVPVNHRERSLFELEDGEWRFVSGGAIPAVSQKVGRNEPCPCGSGKKFKKCCGA
ncbi:MAG TPA: YchJ family metal-binding protein [Pyrinomonadaceae bacterium]|nr:YchJ family metal-binding protein [Pyrinomonadaceae bacterium]